MAPKPRRSTERARKRAAADRARVCLRIRPALSEEEGGVHNAALQCDRERKLAWAMGEDAAMDVQRDQR